MNNRDIIKKKLSILVRLRTYLVYSNEIAIASGIIGKPAEALSMADGQNLAAFRMRYSEYQEQLGKLLQSIAREEDIDIKGASSVAAFAEKFSFIENENDWQHFREIRNGINHDYEEEYVAEMTIAMRDSVKDMANMLEPILLFCLKTYGINITDKTENIVSAPKLSA